MGTEKLFAEGDRWLKTANEDFATAQILMKNEKYAHACFHSQQAAEKAIKAVFYYNDCEPWGHSIVTLIDSLSDISEELLNTFSDIRSTAVKLDRFYIPTRYPNGLPGTIPSEAFTKEDALEAISSAQNIIDRVTLIISDPSIEDGDIC